MHELFATALCISNARIGQFAEFIMLVSLIDACFVLCLTMLNDTFICYRN